MTKRELLDAIADLEDNAKVYIDMNNGLLRSAADVYIDGEDEDIVLTFVAEEETND